MGIQRQLQDSMVNACCHLGSTGGEGGGGGGGGGQGLDHNFVLHN